MLNVNEPSIFYVSSTRFNPKQDFDKLEGKFPERISSDDKRYEFSSKQLETDGYFGIVYKGVDRGDKLDLNIPVAMKVERIEGEEDITVKEARGLARVRDRGVVEVKEIVFFTDDSKIEQMGVVYEWIDGTSIEELSTENMELAFTAYSDVAETLDRLHEQNIVHNDINPRNILVTKDGLGLRTVILDWRISNLCNENRKDYNRIYCSPNALVNNSDFIPTDDNYALLMCMYKTFAGETAFLKYSNRDLENYISLTNYESVVEILGLEIVEKLDEYFKDMLCGDQSRLNSAKKLVEDIKGIIALN